VDDAAQTTDRDETSPPVGPPNPARQAERRVLVYLDQTQRRWLRGIEAAALRDDVRLSASAIVRLAIDELRRRDVSWQGLAEQLTELDDRVRR
jgi:hypothetical protein